MSCLLPGCDLRRRNKEKGQNITSFHRFPSVTSPVRRKWVEFVNRSQVGKWTLRKSDRLCSKHFSLDSFVLNNNNCIILKDNAVPTIMFSSDTKEIIPTRSCNIGSVPLLRCVDKSSLLAPAAPTTPSTHSPSEETVPSSNQVNYEDLLPCATLTPASCSKLLLDATASRCNPDGVVKLVPSSHPVNNPKLLPHATPTTALTCNRNGATVPSSHRVKNPNLFRGSILITRSAVPLLRSVDNLYLLPPASRTSAPIHRHYNASTARNDNDELHKKIEKLQRELARVQKLAKKRFLKIYALKNRVHRLQKTNLEQGIALIELLEKEE